MPFGIWNRFWNTVGAEEPPSASSAVAAATRPVAVRGQALVPRRLSTSRGGECDGPWRAAARAVPRHRNGSGCTGRLVAEVVQPRRLVEFVDAALASLGDVLREGQHAAIEEATARLRLSGKEHPREERLEARRFCGQELPQHPIDTAR